MVLVMTAARTTAAKVVKPESDDDVFCDKYIETKPLTNLIRCASSAIEEKSTLIYCGDHEPNSR